MKNQNESIRNIAIIAHVDHGKTTLVDAMLKQSGIFRANEAVAERVMDAHEDQLDFPVLYSNARSGTATLKLEEPSANLQPLFEAIVKNIPPPAGDPEAVLQMLVANLDYSDYLGRLAIGRVFNGTLHFGDDVVISKLDGSLQKTRITKLYSFEGLKRVDETIGKPGDILAIAGVEGIHIGDTVTHSET